MEVRTKLKKWGNSLGIIIPKEILLNNALKEGEEVLIDIEKNRDLSDVFGTIKNSKLNAQEIKDQIRKQENKDNELLLRHIRNNRDN